MTRRTIFVTILLLLALGERGGAQDPDKCQYTNNECIGCDTSTQYYFQKSTNGSASCYSCSGGTPCNTCTAQILDKVCASCTAGYFGDSNIYGYGCRACPPGCLNCESNNDDKTYGTRCTQCYDDNLKPSKDGSSCIPKTLADKITGPIVAACVAIAVIVVICIFCRCLQLRRKRQREAQQNGKQVPVPLTSPSNTSSSPYAPQSAATTAPPAATPAATRAPSVVASPTSTPTTPAPAAPASSPAPAAAALDDKTGRSSVTSLNTTSNSVFVDDRTAPTSRGGGESVAGSRKPYGEEDDNTMYSAAGMNPSARTGGRYATTADQTTMNRSAVSSVAPSTVGGLDTTISTLQFKQKGSKQAFTFTIDASAVKLVPFEDLEFGNKLGSGGFGTVHRVTQKSTFTEMALKVFPEVSTEEEVEQFVREASVLLNLHHPHCLACLGVVIRDNELAILTEFMDGGDLSQALAKGMGRADKIKALRDVAKGLAYLHGSGITHADLKPSNVLLDSRGRAVLGDFGLAGMTKALGYTERYAAPEVLQGGLPDTCSDVYSFGVVILAVLTATPPFAFLPAGEPRVARDVYLLPGRLSEEYPPSLREAVNRSFASQPSARPHISDVTKALVEAN